MARFISILILLVSCTQVHAEIIHVPKDQPTIQSAVNTAAAGDIVLVSPGRYAERVILKPGIILRSEGENKKGETGLLRAENTILDCGGNLEAVTGVVMADGSTLDGFTVTNVGKYDQELWQKHYDTQGEQLKDEQGAVHDENPTAAVLVNKVNCIVINNIVHHNGHVGIAIMGGKDLGVMPSIHLNVCYRNLGGGIGVANHAEPVVHNNVCYENLRAGIGCRNASPIISSNTCYQNVRAGIGCRETSKPVIRNNKCYRNRRAGIGIRMPRTSPLVENNECYQNDMAGIGSRDGASPTIRKNKCYENKLAGIGCNGSSPLVQANHVQANQKAGIGLRGGANAIIKGNLCSENKLVAIGVTEQSTATIIGNQLKRTGGVPPLIAVKDSSQATVLDNKFSGGGVAALLVLGTVVVKDNEFQGRGKNQGNAVWIRQDSRAHISDNKFVGYRTAIHATGADIVISNNLIRGFQNLAIMVNDSMKPAHVFGNQAYSADPDSKVERIQGPRGIVANNVLKVRDGESD